MKKKQFLISVFVVILALGLAKQAVATSLTFVSDTTWNVLDSSSTSVGLAQNVCLNASSPSSCPSGATLYGFSGSAWGADLSSIPGANWIWAPGITGLTPLASLQQYSFINTFNLSGTPLSGNISLAVDDFASIFVNGSLAGTVGSITDVSAASSAQSILQSFDITPFLIAGTNSIQITAQNGPDSFSGFTNSNYAQNPAGVVFGGTLVSSPAPAPVPEPSTMLLLASGLVGLIGFNYRRNKQIT